ncbi:response regulator [Coraliomargarita parva]|uniref:response regulator n=1 Tax=Coraliomargarita parva TaxID=3014050 RepID=UPI0022B342FD|nr:response regulator transcription factor [Coraliomargarita parva]
MSRALIVEDEELVRELLASVLLREFEFELVDEAGDGEAGWDLFREKGHDFIVLDLMLPKLDGLSLARRILKEQPFSRILALSSECDDYTMREVNRSGILGFVDKKEMTLEVLFAAFNEVSAGYVYYSLNAQNILTRLWEDPLAYYKVLSDREFQVVRAIAQGRTQDQVAEEFGISSFTVRRHKHNAMKKLNLSDEASLLRFALQKGIVKHKGGLDWTEVAYQRQ